MVSKLLTMAELLQIRSDIEAYTLPDNCTIMVVTRTGDGAGGWADTWGTATAGVACRLDPLVGQENTGAGATRDFQRYILTVPNGTTINEAQRVIKGSETFNVINVDAKSWQGCVRVLLERV